ncbi:MAG: acyltransferase [Ruminococcaceae bacterium]|nr:acyltransferase [Oscillospiraceae bacterium]
MEKKYNLCYDILTILACLMVVFFHTNGIIYTYSDSLSWKISVVERCVVYSAIPIFFMLTGAKLMDYRNRYSTKEYVKKRLQRIGIPFLFWNLFYLIYQRVSSPEASFHSAKEFVSMLLNSEFQARYWFFFPLFAVYAAIPVISLVLQAKNHRKYLWYAVYVTFALLWVLNPLCALTGISYNSYLTMPISGGFMIYVLFGYLVSTEQWCRYKRVILYLSAMVSGIFAVGHIVSASAAAGTTELYMASYHFFPAGLTGAAIFVFVKHIFDKPPIAEALNHRKKLMKLIRTVSGCCMGVWLTHSLAIIVAVKLLGVSDSDYVYRFALPPVIFAACVFGVWIVRKIPVLKRIV